MLVILDQGLDRPTYSTPLVTVAVAVKTGMDRYEEQNVVAELRNWGVSILSVCVSGQHHNVATQGRRGLYGSN